MIICVVGPTAIGKTGLAIKLAKEIGGEIISADSMQAYRGMRILSQAPDARQRRAARHHLVGFIDAREEYSVAIFIEKASRAIASIINRGKIPIVAGGSGLYIKGLIDGLFPSPEADLKFRGKMKKLAAKYGNKKLYYRLVKIDPASAEKIHPNDTRRVIRSLEIYHSTGRTMTELKASTKGLAGQYDVRMFGLTAPREEIYRRIDERVERMFRAGVVAEVKRLAKKKISRTAAAALGYKEILEYIGKKGTAPFLPKNYGSKKGAVPFLPGQREENDIKELKDLIKMNTRRLAKRQLTWFRADKRIKWFDVTKKS